jgi:hypothetical protein
MLDVTVDDIIEPLTAFATVAALTLKMHLFWL